MTYTATTHEFAERLLKESEMRRITTDQRYLIGIAGIPGSGKSTIANKLAKYINEKIGDKMAVVVGMDGYHYSRAELNRMPSPEAAHKYRGAHWTFDAEGFRRLVDKAAKDALGVQIHFPTFDHALKDPTPNGDSIKPWNRIIIFEGLYLSLNEAPWSKLPFDSVWLLECPIETTTQRLVDRHIKAGLAKTEEEAKERAQGSDLINAHYILDHILPTAKRVSISD